MEILIVLILIMIAIVGFGGYYIWNEYSRKKNKKEEGSRGGCNCRPVILQSGAQTTRKKHGIVAP